MDRRVLCIDNEGYPVALELLATYETTDDEQAEKRGLIRVIDESGEDYLYPKSRFVSVDISPEDLAALPEEAQEALAKHARLTASVTTREFSTHS